MQLHTKYVPNNSALENFDRSDVATIVNRSLQRLGVSQVDLVQFHWWRYEARNYLAAMEELFKLKSDGKIRHVGITNFDVERLVEMIDAGLKPASIQLQYSLLDRRPATDMTELCIQHGIGILCYGTVAGGFFSEKYLGKSEPGEAETRSNVKYRLIIEEFGGWSLFQQLLKVLAGIAENQNADIGIIASAWTLRQPAVKAVIVGARNLSHQKSNLQIPEINFSDSELSAIAEVLAQSKGPAGPVYGLERYSEKHSSIMHTNNN
mgnify:FL=1